MEARLFLENFAQVAEAPSGVERLRKLVLQLAVRGELVHQDPKEEPAALLLAQLIKEKQLWRRDAMRAFDARPPHEIPSSWEWSRLEQIVDFQLGKTPSTRERRYWSDNGGIPWVSIADMPNQGVVRETKKSVTPDAAVEVFRSPPVPKGTLLMSFKLSIGKIAFLEKDAYHNEAIISIYSPMSALTQYLHRCLRGLNLETDTAGAIKGATLNKATLRALPVPLPPLAEQQRIVAKVDELMALCDELEVRQQKRNETRIALNNVCLDRLVTARDHRSFRRHWGRVRDHFDLLYDVPETVGELRKAILLLAFQGRLTQQRVEDLPASELLHRIKTRKMRLLKERKIKKDKVASTLTARTPPWKIPNSWCWISLQDVFEITRGGSPRPAGDPLYFGGDIPWITVREITKDRKKYLDRTSDGLTVAGSEKSRFVSPGDVLLSNSGATLGVPKISRIEGCINDGVARLRSFHSGVSKDYAYYFLFQQTSAFRSIQQGMGQPNLNTSILAGWWFPLPPSEEQKRVVCKVAELLKLCDELEAKLSQSQAEGEKLTEALVHHLLAGDAEYLGDQSGGRQRSQRSGWHPPHSTGGAKPERAAPATPSPVAQPNDNGSPPTVRGLREGAQPGTTLGDQRQTAKYEPKACAASGEAATGGTPAERILSWLRERPGWHARGEILADLGLSQADWTAGVRDLVYSGALEKKGRKRGTRYRLCGSEDSVALEVDADAATTRDLNGAEAVAWLDLDAQTPAERILFWLEQHPGWHSRAAIGAGLGYGISASDWNQAIRELVSFGEVARTGETRGTKYRALRRRLNRAGGYIEVFQTR